MNTYPKVFIHTVCGRRCYHNITALDGSRTFHEMYIIAISTPFSGNYVLKKCCKISRGKDTTFEVSVNTKGIAIHNYVHPVNLHFHQLK